MNELHATIPTDLAWWVALTALLAFAAKCIWGGCRGMYLLLREFETKRREWDEMRQKMKLVDQIEDRLEALEEQPRCKPRPPGES